MINSFKFLTDNNGEDEVPVGYINLENEDIATWMWESLMVPSTATYQIVSVDTNGIIEFLRMFPSEMIVPVSSIVGPNGLVHCGGDESVGWGFNIQTDPIYVTYLSYTS